MVYKSWKVSFIALVVFALLMMYGMHCAADKNNEVLSVEEQVTMSVDE